MPLRRTRETIMVMVSLAPSEGLFHDSTNYPCLYDVGEHLL